MSTLSDVRLPVVFANYTGDQRHAIGQRMGPNTLREYLWVVDAVYDEEANKTKLGFSYMAPREQVGPVQR